MPRASRKGARRHALHPGGELPGWLIRGRIGLLAGLAASEPQVPIPCRGHGMPSRGRSGIQDRFDVDRIEPLNGRCHDGGPSIDAQRGQSSIHGLIHSEGCEGGAPRPDRCGRPAQSAFMKPAQGSGPEPRSRPLGMAQGSGLPGARGEREAGSALCGLLIAERDEHGEAVQPRPVQITEGGRQHGVILRGRRLKSGRRTPPWHVGSDQRLPSVFPRGNPTEATLWIGSKLDFVVKYCHPS